MGPLLFSIEKTCFLHLGWNFCFKIYLYFIWYSNRFISYLLLEILFNLSNSRRRKRLNVILSLSHLFGLTYVLIVQIPTEPTSLLWFLFRVNSSRIPRIPIWMTRISLGCIKNENNKMKFLWKRDAKLHIIAHVTGKNSLWNAAS